MFTAFLRNLVGFFGLPSGDTGAKALQANSEPMRAIAKKAEGELVDASSAAVAYDENLLERSRTQWQFGDWANLAKLDRDALQRHPDRAKLALLCAAGLQQLGRAEEAEMLTRQALEWDCNPRLVRQMLISGIHNTLARANAILGQEQEAIKHFEAAIDTGTPNAGRLVKAARATFQLNQVGVPLGFQIARERRTSDID